jgi:hypothetical protein
MRTDNLPAIVVVAYNRPASLSRLLRSLAGADYSGYDGIELVIGIDHSDEGQVARIARSFKWKAGPKRVIAREQTMGLRNHVLACGDLASEYTAIVLLEDDLVVAPGFYQYALTALAFYRADPAIAGISLYSFIYNEFANTPFGAIDDGNDVYFLRSAVSWGQIWTAEQWIGFRHWFHANAGREIFAALPKAVREWPETSWKKYFNAYVEATGKYFVVPRYALSTNMGDVGTHFGSVVTRFTAPLSLGRTCFRFAPLAESKCRYDAFFELEAACLKSLAPSVADFDLCVDLNGTKEPSQIGTKYVLTSRPTSGAVKSFGLRHLPAELNVILEEPGDYFSVAPRGQLLEVSEPDLETKLEKMRYFFVPPLNR